MQEYKMENHTGNQQRRQRLARSCLNEAAYSLVKEAIGKLQKS
jgi:hypothetical protein